MCYRCELTEIGFRMDLDRGINSCSFFVCFVFAGRRQVNLTTYLQRLFGGIVSNG